MRLGNPLTYLIHFNQRYMHAGHYTGSSRDLAARLADHASGRGARLMEVVNAAGIEWQLARVWDGGRDRERQLKRQGGASRHCPVCKGQPPDLAAAYATELDPAKPRRARARQPAAERAEEPLWESVAARLTGGEAAALLGELKIAERDAWQQAAREAGQHRSAALEMACDLSRLRSAETSATGRLAEAREIAEREGWTEADLDPQPMTDQHSAGRSQPAPFTPHQEGPEMGNVTEERETVEAAQAGAREADEVTMAAIQSGRHDPEQLTEWARGASERLHGAAATGADRAFAAAFERQALSLAAEYSEAGRSLAACYRQPGSPHPDADLAGRGWRVRECGVYSRARAPEADAIEAQPAELEREAC